jgi:hypothetical protein
MIVGVFLPWIEVTPSDSWNGFHLPGAHLGVAGLVFLLIGGLELSGAVAVGIAPHQLRASWILAALGFIGILPLWFGWQALHGSVFHVIESFDGAPAAAPQRSFAAGYLLCVVATAVAIVAGCFHSSVVERSAFLQVEAAKSARAPAPT